MKGEGNEKKCPLERILTFGCILTERKKGVAQRLHSEKGGDAVLLLHRGGEPGELGNLGKAWRARGKVEAIFQS